MLFNTPEYIFIFLPITIFVYYLCWYFSLNKISTIFLVVASLFFYGYWNVAYLALILLSIAGNYSLGRVLSKNNCPRWVLIFGLVINLSVLGYYKYANFFLENFNRIANSGYSFGEIVLPLAISFFTFQQISYLVDAYQGKAKDYNIGHYSLFVTFFPQLIAGPIVHHSEMMRQFDSNNRFKTISENFAVGVSIFLIGLFKKVVLADNIAIYSDPVFLLADEGQSIHFFDAWAGALAYTFQLYFDFSGYADMAIGSAKIFGINLPLNFNSPYKSKNIIGFWRCWHITLSRFLRDYIYIPLGGNRKGASRKNINLLITMLLGGLWHGAGWNFIIWGGLHGMYLLINHMLNYVISGRSTVGRIIQRPILSVPVTFLCVVIGWVFFRATTLDGALIMLESMFIPDAIFVSGAFIENSANISTSASSLLQPGGKDFVTDIACLPLLILLAWIVFFCKNSTQVIQLNGSNLSYKKALMLGGAAFSVLLTSIGAPESPFLYFQF